MILSSVVDTIHLEVLGEKQIEIFRCGLRLAAGMRCINMGCLTMLKLGQWLNHQRKACS
jgi:hypothetical protein